MKREEYERIVLSPILRERVFKATLTLHIVLQVQQQACGQAVLYLEKTPAPNEAVFSRQLHHEPEKQTPHQVKTTAASISLKVKFTTVFQDLRTAIHLLQVATKRHF
ncbi:hypothetical protein [Pontibacter brevis]